MEQVYFTHDNGGRPFRVNISNSDVHVYKQEPDDCADYAPVFSFTNVKQIFIGKSPLNDMTEFSGGHGDGFDGNSILLELADGTYKFIGDSIFSFAPHSKITNFISPVGNNDVPYPYAIDEMGNTYLMTENVVLVNSANVPKNGNPYEHYYKSYKITPDQSCSPPELPAIKCFGNISNFCMDGNRYTLTYSPFPNEEYDRLVFHFGKNMAVSDENGNIMELTKQTYVKLIEDFGKHAGFTAMVAVR